MIKKMTVINKYYIKIIIFIIVLSLLLNMMYTVIISVNVTEETISAESMNNVLETIRKNKDLYWFDIHAIIRPYPPSIIGLQIDPYMYDPSIIEYRNAQRAYLLNQLPEDSWNLIKNKYYNYIQQPKIMSQIINDTIYLTTDQIQIYQIYLDGYGVYLQELYRYKYNLRFY